MYYIVKSNHTKIVGIKNENLLQAKRSASISEWIATRQSKMRKHLLRTVCVKVYISRSKLYYLHKLCKY